MLCRTGPWHAVMASVPLSALSSAGICSASQSVAPGQSGDLGTRHQVESINQSTAHPTRGIFASFCVIVWTTCRFSSNNNTPMLTRTLHEAASMQATRQTNTLASLHPITLRSYYKVRRQKHADISACYQTSSLRMPAGCVHCSQRAVSCHGDALESTNTEYKAARLGGSVAWMSSCLLLNHASQA